MRGRRWFGGVFGGAELFVNLCERVGELVRGQREQPPEHRLMRSSLAYPKRTQRAAEIVEKAQAAKGPRLTLQSGRLHSDRRAADKGEKEHHQWDRRGHQRQ